VRVCVSAEGGRWIGRADCWFGLLAIMIAS
jgi:hypothetical protein